jgi:hypothetical protein
MRRALPTVVLIVMLLALSPAATAAAQPAPAAPYGVAPSPGSLTEPAGSYFLLDTDPGAELTQSITLRNDSGAPMDLTVSAVDADTANNGGISFPLAGEQPERTGTWIDVHQDTVSLAPSASVDVPFTVRVPSEARSGVHLAGLSVQQVTDPASRSATAEGQAGAAVDVRTRRVIAVQVNVPGPAEPELVINGVSPVARADGLSLEVAIANVGRGLTRGEGHLTLPDEGFESSITFGTFVPDSSIAYPVKWSAEKEGGTHPARVEIRYDGDKVAVWEGDITVGDDVQRDQADRQVESAAPAAASTSGVSVGVLVAAVVATLAVASLIFWLILRRQRRHPTA